MGLLKGAADLKGQAQSRRPRRLLFLPECGAMAHTGRLIALAKAAPDAEIYFAASPERLALVPSHFHKRLVTSLTNAETHSRLNKGQSVVVETLVKNQVEEDLALMREIRPDAVVGDFRISLGISAAVAGVPYINLVQAHWSPWARMPYQTPKVPDHPIFQVLGFRLGRRMVEAAIPLYMWRQAVIFNRLRRAYGLAPVHLSLRHVYTMGDQVLYPDLPELVPTPGAPAHHRYIGPVLWEPSVPLPEWWNALPDGVPIVYVSMGSTGDVKCLPGIVDALLRLPVVTVLATAGGPRPRDVPGRLYSAEYLPGMKACGRASLVINNGGMGGVYQAMAAGVPVIAVAANLDQTFTMRPLVKRGAGLMIPRALAGRTGWKDTISRMLGNTEASGAAKTIASLIHNQTEPLESVMSAESSVALL